MKNVIKTIVAAACGVLLLNANVSALPIEAKAECKNNKCENFRIGMYRIKNTLTMNFLLEKTRGEKLSLRLLNEKGQVMHQETIRKGVEKYGRKFNFSEIADGNYILEVSDENEKIVKNINLTTNEVKEIQARTLLSMN